MSDVMEDMGYRKVDPPTTVDPLLGLVPALSPEQAATVKALKAAWFLWSESGRQGTAWEFILWYEKRLRGSAPSDLVPYGACHCWYGDGTGTTTPKGTKPHPDSRCPICDNTGTGKGFKRGTG